MRIKNTLIVGWTLSFIWGSLASANPITFADITYTEKNFIGAYLVVVIPCLLIESFVESILFQRIGF